MTLPVPPPPPPPRPRPRYRRPGWLVLGGLALVVGGAAAVRAWRARPSDAPGASAPALAAPSPVPPPGDTAARPPAGARVKVEVVNASRVRGLARRATRALRDRGYDVVAVGTTETLRDSVLVLDRSGHPDWARRAARAMGGARVASRPDSSRYLDLTVLVGRTWRPPPDPLDP